MSEEVVSLGEYASPLGRRFRALKLWATLRCFGREGLQAVIREHIRLAALFERWVEDEPGWELCAPRPFSLVCFRREGSDDLNRALMERVNERGEIFLSHTKLDGRFVLRLAVGSARTTEADVALAWDVLRREAGRNLEHDRPARRERLDQALDHGGVAVDLCCTGVSLDEQRVQVGRRAGHDCICVLDQARHDRAPVERGLLAGDVEADPRVRGVRDDSRSQRLLEPAGRRLEVVRRRAEGAEAPAGERGEHGAERSPVPVSS